jgi:gas vesicle protein
MRTENSNDKGSEDPTIWSAFITGTLMGAGAALLFAPQSGTELRSMLFNYANRAKEALMDNSHEAWETVERDEEYDHNGAQSVREAGRSVKEFTKQAQDMIREPGRSAL